jgi:HAD superfamily hydrolase (TIGR01509 family)
MIKALIFDCFGVFYADPVFAYMRNPQTPPEKAKALHILDERAARGTLSKNDFVAQSAELLNISASDAEQRFFHSNKRNDALIEYVKELRKSYKIAMLSNIGGDMMDGFFKPQERQELFDAVVLSGDVKMAKPDKAIFEITCQRLGVELYEAIMIDDMQSTCGMVKTYGMKSVCYKDFEQCKNDLRVLLSGNS